MQKYSTDILNFSEILEKVEEDIEIYGNFIFEESKTKLGFDLNKYLLKKESLKRLLLLCYPVDELKWNECVIKMINIG